MINSKSQVRIGSVLGIVYTVLQAVISVVYIPILLKGIGKAEYGLYQILGSIIAYFSAMEAPLSSSVTRYYTLYKADNNQIKMENTLALSRRIFLAMSGVFLLLSIPTVFIIRAVNSSSFTVWELNEATIMFAIMIVNTIVSLNNFIYVACINAHEKFVFLKLISIVFLIMQPIAVVLLIKRIPYAYIIVSIQLVMNIALSLIRMVYCKKKLGVKVVYHGKDKALIKNIFSLSLFVLIVALADQIFWKTDQLILGAKYGTELVSIYSIGAQLNSMFISVGCVLNGVLLPTITKLSKEEDAEKKLSSFFGRFGRAQSYLVLLIVTGVIAFGKEFIFLISDSTFEDAYYVALLLMVPYSIDLIQNCGNSILQVKDLYYCRSIVFGAMAVINLALTFLFVNLFGMIGAALATLVSIVIGGILMNIVYKTKANLNIAHFFKSVAFIWLVAACVCPSSILINMITIENKYIQFIIHVLIYLVVYALAMLLVLNKDEKNMIKETIGKISKRERVD